MRSTVVNEAGCKFVLAVVSKTALRGPSTCSTAESESVCSFAVENGEFHSHARILHCESSVPSFCSETQECSDCSSIISSISYESLDECGEVHSRIPTYLNTPDDNFGAVKRMSFDTAHPHVHDGFLSVASSGVTCTSADDHSMFGGDEMGRGGIRSASSPYPSLAIDEMRSMMLSPMPSREPNSRSDVFDALPGDIASYILSFLDVESLCDVGLVSRQARVLSSRDDAGWKMHCQNLWSRKTFVLQEARNVYASCNAMNAYKLSIFDANSREEIRPEELCFDSCRGEGIVWEFRFKKSAGSVWTSIDPWWAGGNARTMVFLRDGTVKQIVRSHDFSKYVLYPPFYGVAHEGVGFEDGVNRSIHQCEMSWRFVEQPMDLPPRGSGSYIRISVDGREVPTYVVRRSPTGDWGFVIESCWGVYSMAPLTRLEVLTSQSTRVGHPRMRLRLTPEGGARWINVDGIESDSDDEEESQLHPNVDAKFTISTQCQWREALLYNYGAITLPEGEHATAEFDRVWSQSFRQG